MIQRPNLRLLDRVIDARNPGAGTARFQRWHTCKYELTAVIRYPGVRQCAYVPASSLLYITNKGNPIPCEEARQPFLSLKRANAARLEARRKKRREYMREYVSRQRAGLPTYRRTRKATAAAATRRQRSRPAAPAGVPWLKWLFMDADHSPTPQEERIAEIFISEYAALQRRLRPLVVNSEPEWQDEFAAEFEDAAA